MKAKTTLEKWETVCVICSEAITQPICIDCLEQEVVYWLLSKDPDFIPLVEGISEFFRSGEDKKKTVCILCGREMNVCTYCFKNEIYDLLIQSDLGLAEEFKEGFFDHYFDYNPGLINEAS